MTKKDAAAICSDDSDSSDSDDENTVDTKQKKVRHNKTKHVYDFGKSCKLGCFMFIVFILIMSDVFIERVMSKSKMDLVSGRTPTKKGICVQGILIVIAIILLDFLICKEKI